MMRSGVFLMIVLFYSGVGAQERPVVKYVETKPHKLVVSSFAYPFYYSAEEHASFLVERSFGLDFELALRGFYDTYLTGDRVRLEVLSKFYFTGNGYFFMGMESEFMNSKYGRKALPPRIGVIGGLGYRVRANVLIEVKGNFQINESPMGVYGEPFIPMPQVYTLGNRIKF